MDIFYKPPLQRPDECEALEENYMNCLMQKAMKDNVIANKCVMDSILWFHLECPKSAAKFDDRVELKRKFRDFLALTKTQAEDVMKQSDASKRMQQQYAHVPYPEDVKQRSNVIEFTDEFKHLDPEKFPESEDDWETEMPQ